MKPYGYKKSAKRNLRGDGCFLCTKARKTTKSAIRSKAKTQAVEDLSDHYQAEIDEIPGKRKEG